MAVLEEIDEGANDETQRAKSRAKPAANRLGPNGPSLTKGKQKAQGLARGFLKPEGAQKEAEAKSPNGEEVLQSSSIDELTEQKKAVEDENVMKQPSRGFVKGFLNPQNTARQGTEPTVVEKTDQKVEGFQRGFLNPKQTESPSPSKAKSIPANAGITDPNPPTPGSRRATADVRERVPVPVDNATRTSEDQSEGNGRHHSVELEESPPSVESKADRAAQHTDLENTWSIETQVSDRSESHGVFVGGPRDETETGVANPERGQRGAVGLPSREGSEEGLGKEAEGKAEEKERKIAGVEEPNGKGEPEIAGGEGANKYVGKEGGVESSTKEREELDQELVDGERKQGSEKGAEGVAKVDAGSDSEGAEAAKDETGNLPEAKGSGEKEGGAEERANRATGVADSGVEANEQKPRDKSEDAEEEFHDACEDEEQQRKQALTQAEGARVKGNALYAAADYQAALDFYAKALQLAPPAFIPVETPLDNGEKLPHNEKEQSEAQEGVDTGGADEDQESGESGGVVRVDLDAKSESPDSRRVRNGVESKGCSRGVRRVRRPKVLDPKTGRLVVPEEKGGEGTSGRGGGEEAGAKVGGGDEVPAPEEKPDQEAVDCRAACHANRAACFVQLELQEAIVKECNEALKLKPDYLKVLIRRAQAYDKLDKQEEAQADWKSVQEKDPSNRQARTEVRRLEPIVNEKREKMKEEMMGKLKDLGNSLLGHFGLSVDNFKAVKDPNTGGYSINFSK